MSCPRCDRPVATEADFARAEQPGDDALCWDATTCPPYDWRAEALRLRAIVEGREKPPSAEEAAAHADAHPCTAGPRSGWWMVTSPGVEPIPAVLALRVGADGRVSAGFSATDWQELPALPDGTPHTPGARWRPLANDGRPTAWPTPQ